jgi:vesicle coat complex subunit
MQSRFSMNSKSKNALIFLFNFYRAAGEVDVDFVRKAVKAIGRCAIKMEKAAEKCIQVLLDLIQTKVNHVVQEAIVVIKVKQVLSWVNDKRISSESTPADMRALFPLFVKILNLWMNQRPKLL